MSISETDRGLHRWSPHLACSSAGDFEMVAVLAVRSGEQVG